MPLADIWYRAAAFKSDQACRAAWTEIRDHMAAHHLTNVPTVTCIIDGMFHLVSASDHALNTRQIAIVEHAMNRGTPTSVDDHVLAQIMNRHQQKLAKMRDEEIVFHESHTPQMLDGGSTHLSAEQIMAQRSALIKSLAARGFSFAEIYAIQCEWLDVFNAGQFETPESFADLVRRNIKVADKYLFTESAQRMHQAVATNETCFIPPPRSLWIEFDPPLFDRLKAMHVFQAIEDQMWIINVVNATTCFHEIGLMYDAATDTINAGVSYTCPYGECRDIEEKHESGNIIIYRNTCDRCIDAGSAFMAYLHTAMELIQRKYATEPDPPAWPIETINHTELQHVPRNGNPKKLKTKVVIHETPYIVVKYDVSVKQRARLDDIEHDTELSTQPRANWLTMHGSDDIIYECIDIPAFDRRWPLRRDGTRTSEDAIHVESFTRWQPLLRADVRKTAIKRVVASRYKENVK